MTTLLHCLLVSVVIVITPLLLMALPLFFQAKVAFLENTLVAMPHVTVAEAARALYCSAVFVRAVGSVNRQGYVVSYVSLMLV